MANNPYTNYYLEQAGSGMGNVYSGVTYQKGFGIGSFLGGLFRRAIPLLSMAGKALGSEFFKTSGNIVSDIVSKKPWREAVQARMSDAGNNITSTFGHQVDNLLGKGYKRRTHKKLGQSLHRRGRVKKRKISPKHRVNLLPRDIFS